MLTEQDLEKVRIVQLEVLREAYLVELNSLTGVPLQDRTDSTIARAGLLLHILDGLDTAIKSHREKMSAMERVPVEKSGGPEPQRPWEKEIEKKFSAELEALQDSIQEEFYQSFKGWRSAMRKFVDYVKKSIRGESK